jgi:hypothetical protein
VIGTASIFMLLLVAQQADPQTGRHPSPLRDFVTMTLSGVDLMLDIFEDVHAARTG